MENNIHLTLLQTQF